MLTAALSIVALLLALGAAGALRGRAGAVIVYGGSALASLALAGIAFTALVEGAAFGTARLALPLGLPWLQANLQLDLLSAWFLLAINLPGAAAALFGLGYAPHGIAPRRILPAFPVYLGAMNLVPLADDAFVFLFAWELMSLASWLLVVADDRAPAARHAGLVYLVMAAVGTACLLLAFGALGGFEGNYHFADIRVDPPHGWLGGIILALALLGAGGKAGALPLHVWLPLAHPAAPSHVSALMSGAMTKVALYGLVRIAFDLAGEVPWGWGAAIMAVGAATALLGVLSALMQDDLKTLLAWSTIENIGIILLALGLALVFRASGLPDLAAVALVAALLHALNHALFKSLLFLGAGAVAEATGTRALDRLGGLIHRMPRLGALMLLGAAAIAALPPLNGFVSEWLLFQAILDAPSLPQWPLKFAVPVAGAALALAAALAAACFVRAFAIVFLGRPRSAAVAQAQEAPILQRAPMAALGALCVVIGLIPAVVIGLANPIVLGLVGVRFPTGIAGPGLEDWLVVTPFGLGQAAYSGLAVAAGFAALVAVTVIGLRRLAPLRLRRAPAWDCGFPDPAPRTQYTAGSLAQPLRRVFAGYAFGAAERVDMPEPGDPRPARFVLVLRDPVWTRLYQPLLDALAALAEAVNLLQSFSIRRYLSLMFAALVALLIATTFAQ